MTDADKYIVMIELSIDIPSSKLFVIVWILIVPMCYD